MPSPLAYRQTHSILVDRDRVTVNMTIHGTHRESAIPPLTAISPTGKRIRWKFIHLLRVSGGQVVEHFAVRDDLGLLRQLHGAGPYRRRPGFAPTERRAGRRACDAPASTEPDEPNRNLRACGAENVS